MTISATHFRPVTLATVTDEIRAGMLCRNNTVVELDAGAGRVMRVAGLLPLRVWGGAYRQAWHLRAGDRVLVGGVWHAVLRVGGRRP